MGARKSNVIAVGLGPGSYTGIRVAMSIAQGWQLATGVKLLGIGSVECLAAQAQAEKMFGRVNVVIDAQRGEFYLATFEIMADGAREISPLKIVTVPEVEAHVGAEGNFNRPGDDEAVSVGNRFVSASGDAGDAGRDTAPILSPVKNWSRFICARRIL